MAKQEFKFVGQNVLRVDGVEKVTGKAKFTGDLKTPGMLYGRILRSPYPHARIVSIATSAAEALPGVAAVLTAADLSDVYPYYSGLPVIAVEKVRYAGEPVAAVAAEDQETAEEALSLITVSYEELPAAVGLNTALRKGAPLIHENLSDNICSHEHVEKGNVEQGFAESDEIFEDPFPFPMVYHYAMEPHSVIADFNDEGITVWSSAQHPFQVRGDLAKIFGLHPAKVRIIIPFLGGGFGSKSYTKFEPLVVALARKARRPGSRETALWSRVRRRFISTQAATQTTVLRSRFALPPGSWVLTGFLTSGAMPMRSTRIPVRRALFAPSARRRRSSPPRPRWISLPPGGGSIRG